MSIEQEIDHRISEGRLTLLEPLIASDPKVRKIFVGEEVREFVEGPWQNDSHQERAMRLRADLDAFIRGAPISIAAHPYQKPNDSFLAPIDPISDSVYAIRNRIKPSIRLVGCFAAKDIFVALVWAYRIDLGQDKRTWRNLSKRCKAEWKSLFNTYQPLPGADRDQLASRIIRV
ncbi:hypothetical protein [Hyphomonas sp.]|uniref:hypothetical protein n=1 Tax=Hyphomonas sp. TaxID=87 RepID=UPI0025BD9D4A|nr:hypothetical protein [Hyphomonas sp.]